MRILHSALREKPCFLPCWTAPRGSGIGVFSSHWEKVAQQEKKWATLLQVSWLFLTFPFFELGEGCCMNTKTYSFRELISSRNQIIFLLLKNLRFHILPLPPHSQHAPHKPLVFLAEGIILSLVLPLLALSRCLFHPLSFSLHAHLPKAGHCSSVSWLGAVTAARNTDCTERCPSSILPLPLFLFVCL